MNEKNVNSDEWGSGISIPHFDWEARDNFKKENPMRKISMSGIQLFALAVMAAVIAVGCASAPLHSETTASGIRAAEEVGAAQIPKASLHLQLAKEELERAQGLNKAGEEEQAASMLMRAEADAELAVALSHGDAERIEAEEAMERARKLQQENK